MIDSTSPIGFSPSVPFTNSHRRFSRSSRRTTSASVAELSSKLKTQRGIKIDHEVIPGANHFFQEKIDDLVSVVGSYVDMRLAKDAEERETRRDLKLHLFRGAVPLRGVA